tara:strand:- start:481 stop:897 length:417 start_codon:yes stop_codon:yes gene_type:complete
MKIKNLTSIKLSNSILKLIGIIFIILITNITYEVKALNTNWVEVNKTLDGKQYWDRNSLINKGKGIIEITTKYLRIDSNTKKILEQNIYLMRINCQTNQYKDISINGKNNLIAKWEDPNGDKLINEVISNSCKNASNY